jgi:hypothetical protein
MARHRWKWSLYWDYHSKDHLCTDQRLEIASEHGNFHAEVAHSTIYTISNRNISEKYRKIIYKCKMFIDFLHFRLRVTWGVAKTPNANIGLINPSPPPEGQNSTL